MAGIKINLKEAILLKSKTHNVWKIKGKDSSGANFSWQSPVAFSVDLSLDNRVILFIRSDSGGTHRIDWGEGEATTSTTTSTFQGAARIYEASTGVFDVKVTSSVPFSVSCPSETVAIKGYYGNNYNKLSSAAAPNLVSVPGYLPPNITDIGFCLTNATLFNDPAVATWDTSKVVNMDSVFRGASAFNQDISGWDTSNVTDMEDLFSDAHAFNQNISGWNTSSVTNMKGLFWDASAFNQNISGWDTSSVTDMSFMFSETDAFNQNISGWDTSSVTAMAFMFDEAVAFNQNISGWNTSNVTNMLSMFKDASAFNQNLGSWDISSATTFSGMFDNSGLSTENYSRTLIGWANSHFAGNAQDNVFLGATAVTYNNTTYTTGNQFNDAVSARNYLVNTAGWTITDGGQV